MTNNLKISLQTFQNIPWHICSSKTDKAPLSWNPHSNANSILANIVNKTFQHRLKRISAYKHQSRRFKRRTTRSLWNIITRALKAASSHDFVGEIPENKPQRWAKNERGIVIDMLIVTLLFTLLSLAYSVFACAAWSES